MFEKKCSQCGNKIKTAFEFCPSCGKNLNSQYDKEDFGILGKNDVTESDMPMSKTPFIERFVDNAMKILERQMKDLQKELVKDVKAPKEGRKLNIQFYINGKKVFPEKKEIKNVRQLRVINNKDIQDKLRKFSNLPKQEPESKLKRYSGRLIYEISVPGVKSVEDILINELESSIEIKALSEEKIYSKNLNIKLPIIKYNLKKDILILELKDM